MRRLFHGLDWSLAHHGVDVGHDNTQTSQLDNIACEQSKAMACATRRSCVKLLGIVNTPA